MTDREQELFRLAEKLRAEVLYMHETGDVADSIRNTAGDGLLEEAERLLGSAD